MAAIAEKAPMHIGEMAKLTLKDLSLGDSRVANFNPQEYQTIAGGIPMPEIPFGSEWTNQVNPDDIHVAEHELGHAFVAFRMGIGLRFATVIPNYSAGYRGLTVLEHGHVDPYDLQIISAAGSHKSSRGNGSDMMVHQAHGGRSFEESLAQAKGIIGSLTPEEWKLMVQIFAYKRTITENDIPQMIRRARYELGRGITPDESLFVEKIQTIRSHIQQAEGVGVIRDEIIEEKHEDGTIKRYHRVNGVIDETTVEIFCASCGMKDGHMIDCAQNKEETVVFHGQR